MRLEVVEVPRVVLEFIFLAILVQSVVLTSEATSELASVEISCVLYLNLITDLVVNNLPVLSLDSVVYLLVVIPVDILIFAFSYFGYLLKVLKGVTFSILVEWLSLSQLLQDLKPSR